MSGNDDNALRALAEAAGVSTGWRDVHGADHSVSPETLRAVLAALGLPADVSEAHAVLAAAAARLPPLLTAVPGMHLTVPDGTPGHRYRIDLEQGGQREGQLDEQARLAAPDAQGYHRLTLDGGQTVLAVSPGRCPSLAQLDAARHRDAAPWGLAVQIASLRRPGDGGIGDFGSVAVFAAAAARHGAAALAISPAHALFSADPSRYGPYAPSSRLALNVLLADPKAAFGAVPEPTAGDDGLIDWPEAARRKLAHLRTLFDAEEDDPRFVVFRREAGLALEQHARFEALHAHFFGQDPARWHWRDWPAPFASPDAPGVALFAREHARDIAFHAFCQWLADASRAEAQRAAKEAGMPIGLIADLAVGTDGGGSHAWSRQAEIITGLSVGAPPDVFSPLGQDWGLTAFSPLAMREGGFAAFLELLRAAFRHAGGIRVDHAMGLQRLWVVPQGAGPAEGAYLHYPVDDLVRLLALEAHRHVALVIGEDLGTLPEGFHGRMADAGILGMRVLWFEQDWDGAFRPPHAWSRDAVALSTTHDLPTVVGWWQGRDIAWRERLGRFPSPDTARQEQERRDRDRGSLWRTMLESGAATGDQPSPDQPDAVLEAVPAHLGATATALAILPVEDALGEAEQPNLPGTVEEHPNWRRRLPGAAATLLDAPGPARRLAAFARARRRPDPGT
jgi:4-alpha-glucanotransferase